MDAKYLRDNVNEALIEALASMAVSMPDDSIEYVGKYLIQYVERKALKEKAEKRFADTDAAARVARDAEIEKESVEAQLQAKRDEHAQQLQSFLGSVSAMSKNKQEIMDRTTEFLAGYLNVPAAYVAIKRVNGETETLNYVSSNPGQGHVVGNKVIKQPEDAEEPPVRQGLSFDTFKLPEMPEVEEVELEEGQEPPPKAIPKPSPIHIENVMRDQRIKFFGIPKLGAYASIPLEYQSVDHENGCTLQVNEETGESAYVQNKVTTQLILAMDTIGKYRRFQQSEIDLAVTVGACMITAIEHQESKMYDCHINCLNAIKPLLPPVNEALEELKAKEEEAAAAATAELSDEEKAEVGPLKEAQTRALFWTQKIINPPLKNAVCGLVDYVLPVPAPVSTLLFAVGCLVGIDPNDMKDPCKDISWDQIKLTSLHSLSSDAFTYNAEEARTVKSEASAAKIREMCDAANVFDPGSYPGHFAGLVPVSIWLQKNLTARDTAIAYFKDVKNESIEKVLYA